MKLTLHDVVHLFDRATDGGKVGHHSSQPAFGDEGHAHAAGRFGDHFARLLLGGHVEDFTTGFGDLLHGIGGAVEALLRAVEVNEVNAFALHEDVRLHLGIPLSLEVAKVYTSIQQFFIGRFSHF